MPDKKDVKKPKAVVKKTAPKRVAPKIEEPEVIVEEVIEVVEPEIVTKAGKHSAKALAEAKVLEEKKARVAENKDDTQPVKKLKQNPTRPKIDRMGKKYREASKLIDKTKTYTLSEAIDLAIKSSPTKFDATAELHVRLGVDPKHADQNIRDNIVLPSGTGKTIRIAVFADDKEVEAAKKAGADIAVGDPFLEQLDKSVINFDILIATPTMMPKLGKYARILGPKGLMPNPKNGTVTTDTAKAVKEAKAGKVEYKIDGSGIVHLGFGKISFGKDKLIKNAEVVLGSIKANKPSSLKGNYVLSVFLTTTMGPSIKIDNNI
jgi:large subunit ribosomal protein L1